MDEVCGIASGVVAFAGLARPAVRCSVGSGKGLKSPAGFRRFEDAGLPASAARSCPVGCRSRLLAATSHPALERGDRRLLQWVGPYDDDSASTKVAKFYYNAGRHGTQKPPPAT